MKNLDLDELEIFGAVATSGTVTGAATRLGRAPSNVSTRLRQLESRLGMTLFDRRKGRLKLSPQGELLLTYSERLLRLSSEAESAVKQGSPRGVFRIGSLESTAAARLPPILGRYHRTYPDVRVELVTGTSAALVTRVLSGDIEAAFVAEPFPGSGLETHHAFNERLVLITPRDMANLETSRVLDHATLIVFAVGCSYRRRLDDWLGHMGVAPVRVMEFASYHAILACVAAGSGVAVVPRSVITALKASAEVKIHQLPANVANARTQLVWREGESSIAIAALRHEIRTPQGLAAN